LSEFPKILGVFSRSQAEDIGSGGTQRKHEGQTFWYVRRLDDETFEVQPLNANHVPSGVKTMVPRLEFLHQYAPEPDYYRMHTVPALESLARKLREGERYFSLGMLDEAELKFVKALMIDDLNVDANYGLGKVYSEKNDYEKLRKVVNTLMGIEGAFSYEHRRQLNEFGMNLRKNGHFEESIRYYSKALEHNRDDEHLLFNLARAHWDRGNATEAQDALENALKLNPEFTEAKKFLNYCRRR